MVKLLAISDFFKRIFGKEQQSENTIEEPIVQNVKYEIDEEDRIIIALAASIMAGKDKPNSHFHISKITRIQ